MQRSRERRRRFAERSEAQFHVKNVLCRRTQRIYSVQLADVQLSLGVTVQAYATQQGSPWPLPPDLDEALVVTTAEQGSHSMAARR